MTDPATTIPGFPLGATCANAAAGNNASTARMVVFRSNKQIYVQVVDDLKGATLCAAASNDKALAAECKGKTGKEAAAIVGKAIAERALAKGITTISFDRGGYLYHGRVKSLADAAREGGLIF